MEYKIIIAGGRDFYDYCRVRNEFIEFRENFTVGEEALAIVSGCAGGADRLGIWLAEDFNLELYKFPADWDKHGRGAGFIRNTKMGKFADAALIFWDGESRGTKHMIQTMDRLNKPYKIFSY